MTVENIDSEFLSFLESSTKIKDCVELAIHRNESTLAIDLQDVNEYSEDLFLEIIKKFSQKHEQLNKTVELYSSKHFDHKIHNVSFYNNDGIYKIRDLKSVKLGQLISFSGTATRTTQVRPELISGSFVCKECNSVIDNVEQEFKYTEPLVCPNHLCTNRRNWTLEIEESRFSNWQRIHVQENTDEIPPGALPRSMDVIVRDDLVERVKAGDKVLFTGYLVVVPDVVQLMMPQSKSVPAQEGVSDVAKHKRNLNIKDLNYKLCFMCVHVNYKIEESIEFTNEELKAIEEIRNTQNLYYKLSQSLFPSIHGHYSIKNAILLLLAGGVSKTTESGVKLRGDINVLLVGDPGTAKSQFLKQTSGILPRSVYTSGKSSSAAGLTACVVRDGESGEISIEAGALMLSDNGVCCIDEFDKMNYKDQVSIHEAMEQQTITIAKAGINATLNARASILAAANPIKGRYDKRKTLRQNINLSQPIMSRFDLYFVLIDDVDRENDTNIANHVLHNHQMSVEVAAQESYFTLEQIKLYLKYIKSIKPKLTDESYDLLVKNYSKIRQESLVNSNNYKMTVRHLESMIRLSEALAKIHCDTEVRKQYVDEAYRLISSSVIELKGEDIEIRPVDPEKESVIINNKDIVRITNSLVYLIKTHEPMTKEALVECYLEQIESTIETEQGFYAEKDNSERVIDYLLLHEGVLFVSEDLIYIHPNYDV
ncbi:DNA replication licensing factor MCM6 [Nosema granulosis]|uniref:DNA replication licensing factor MCM6 n=1 Tax=Nosema granulosis TaxID=83296 RepID=A0A9P6GXB0_9MICR|nr:DNA replication licensing factor MCM6 [Nosema granulosis]